MASLDGEQAEDWHGVWLVTAPIALAGVEAAHALANSLVGPPEGRGELFAASASSASSLLPAAAALALGSSCSAWPATSSLACSCG